MILNDNGASIKSVRGLGYKLVVESEQDFRKFLQDNFHEGKEEIIPTLREGRVHYIIKRLLLTDKYLRLEDLADELFISRSTIANDFKEVKERLGKFDIKVEKKSNHGLRLNGEEVKLRFCMSEFLFSRQLDQTELIYDPAALISSEELSVIRSIIIEEIKEADITLSDISLNNMVVHIAIACKRIRDGNYVSVFLQEQEELARQKEYAVSKRIVQKIEVLLYVTFPETEISYITIHLLGTKLMTQHTLNDSEITNYIDESILELTRKMLAEMEHKMRLGIGEDKELFIGLSLHLKPALNRFHFNMNLRNPMLDEIKTNYPIPFEAGVVAAGVLKKELGYDIKENEIAYLALHIGAALERKKAIINKKRCMIVCASGVGSASLLYYKLKSQFHADLDIIGTTELYKVKDLDFTKIDLIISTIPIKEELPVSVIQVNTILGEKDYTKINQQLFVREDHKNISVYMKEELVFLQKNFDTKEETLCFLEKELMKTGLIDSEFMKSVKERETVSPTCFGNLVAIPHPIVPQTEETFWAFCTLQKPIDWGGKNVQFICLLSVQKNTTGDIQNMYDVIGDILDSTQMVQQLIKCTNFPEFKSLLPF